MKGLLTMIDRRNFANISRKVNGLQDDGQNIQQFMSDSTWDARAVFDQIQREVSSRPELRGGMLCIDESGDPKSGDKSAGAGRQHIGRLGKIDMGQVGVAISYYIKGIWTLLDAELFMPIAWFDDEHKKLWSSLHIPDSRQFATKIEIALDLIKRARANGVPFVAVCFDELYGRNNALREKLDQEGIIYVGDIPRNTNVYLEKPDIEPDKKLSHKKSAPANGGAAVKVESLTNHPAVAFKTVKIRHTERGLLKYRCAALRVWTVCDNGNPRQEWLLIRREHDGGFSFSLSNAPAGTSPKQLAVWKCERYFAERTFQDIKSEIGWDELEARKYRSWMHHTALSALALWFIAQTKLDWSVQYPRDPKLLEDLNLKVLPLLSVSNVREMLMAAMPMEKLSPDQSIQLVTQHLVNRSRSTASRLNSQRQPQNKKRGEM